jgi:hypothetical protein
MLGGSVLLAASSACGPVGPPATGWADLPMAGIAQGDETPLAQLHADPASYAGKTVRTSVRVVEAVRDAQGIFLFVVPRGAPLDASPTRLLVPPGQGGDEFLEIRGRDLVLVMRVEGVRSTLGVYEAALIVTPLSHVSLFGSPSDGGEEAAAAGREIERMGGARAAEPPAP